MQYLSAVPAYGRDYKSKKAVREAWDSGADFRLEPSGSYVNREDAPKGATINIRFKALREVCPIVVK